MNVRNRHCLSAVFALSLFTLVATSAAAQGLSGGLQLVSSLSSDTTYAANSLIIPMDTTYQDNGMFLAYGLIYDLLQDGIPIDWIIKPAKSYGEADFYATGVDVQTGMSIVNYGYRGGPFVIDSFYYSAALPIVQQWQALYTGLKVHRATQPFVGNLARQLLVAPTIAVFADGNENIAFNYLNAAQLPQSFFGPGRQGNRVVAGTAASKPTVTSAPAGNSTISGTSGEATGSVVQMFINGLFAGTTTVQAGGIWSLGPVAIPPGINVTAAVTASGKGTSQMSANKASGNLPAGGTSAAPVITGPIRSRDATVRGTSTEADTTLIKLFKNGALLGTTTVTAGKWAYVLAVPAVGGDTWNATATAPLKTESALSTFVTTVPVPATVTPSISTGDTSIAGTYKMTNGSRLEIVRTRSGSDTVLGTATVANSAWSFTASASAIAAGDEISARPANFPWPDGKAPPYACPGADCCADCLTEAGVQGPTTTNHRDGTLFDSNGHPRFCQFMSMHYGAPGDAEIVAETREFLSSPTHAFMECQAVNAFENVGHFLTTNGLESTGVTATGPFYYFGQDSPFAQTDGTYNNPGGSEQSYSLASGSSYYDSNVVHLSAANLPAHGDRDIWMTGYMDGMTTNGKISYLGGHSYTTALPISSNPKSVGARYFLNSLFEAPCTSESVASLELNLSGPDLNNGGSSTYTVHYSAIGVGILKQLTIQLPLPGNVNFSSATNDGYLSGSTVVWNLGDVAAGTEGDLQVTVTFGQDGTYNFQASGNWISGTTPRSLNSGVVTTIRNTVVPPAPTVNFPIYAGATAVSGTSTQPVGSTITVYKNGISIGTTSVQTNGTWTLEGISATLVVDDSITAAVTVHGMTSAVSAAVVVLAPPSIPPIVSSPIYQGASVDIEGSSVEAEGSTVTLYVGGAPVGTAIVQADGTWVLPGILLSEGQVVTARVQAAGKSISPVSNTVVVCANADDRTPAPLIGTPVVAGASSLSGTSVPGATVDVYADGYYMGTTAANSLGEWTLSGLSGFPEGTILSATATAAPAGTSVWSPPVVVGSIIDMLRNDSITAFPYDPASIFVRQFPGRPAMDPLGRKHRAFWGEGALQQDPGSSDDDDSYFSDVHSGDADLDTTVLTDSRRLLVSYELLDNGTKTLRLTKAPTGTGIIFTILP